MLARVIHFGPDDCHRLMVLRSAGYTVDDCRSLMQLRVNLETGIVPDAVLMSDGDGVSPEEAAALARSRACHPLILFRTTHVPYEDGGFDLVVPCLTPPEIWLNEMDALIERTRAGLRP
jgi:hypothetical protein